MLTISVEQQHHAEFTHIQDDTGFDCGDQMISELICRFILLTLTLSTKDAPILKEPDLADAFPAFNHDNVKVEYHPNSGITTSIVMARSSPEPWFEPEPFQT